jgi:hypothetical protein
MAGVGIKSVGYLIGGFSSVIKAVLYMSGTIVTAAAKAFGWVPGVGDKLRNAEKDFNTYRDKAVGALDGAAKAAGTTGDKLVGMSKKALDAADAVGKVRDKASQLRNRKITLEVLDRVTASVGRIQRVINNVRGKQVVVGIQVGTVSGAGGVRGFSKGGRVTGGIPGKDSVPSLLMPGERVLTVAQNRAWERGVRPAEWTRPAASAPPAPPIELRATLVLPDGSVLAETLLAYDRNSGGDLRRRLAVTR